MNAEEVLDKHISKMLNRLPGSFKELSDMKKLPEYQYVIDAMNDFYNQAIEDLIAADLIPDKEINREKFRK